MTTAVQTQEKQRKEREPICGLCWMNYKYIPLQFIIKEQVWYCPHCGRRTYEPPPEDEEDAIAQAFYAQEGWDRGIPGQPPWRQGLHQTRAELPGGSRNTGRRKAKPKRSTPWYRMYGEV